MFSADVAGPDGANCAVDSEEKEICGDIEITRNECVAKGCCWYTREFEGAPYCFCRLSISYLLNIVCHLKKDCWIQIRVSSKRFQQWIIEYDIAQL